MVRGLREAVRAELGEPAAELGLRPVAAAVATIAPVSAAGSVTA